MPQQTVSGIHTRLYARAYIVADPNNERCVLPRLSAFMVPPHCSCLRTP